MAFAAGEPMLDPEQNLAAPLSDLSEGRRSIVEAGRTRAG